MMLLFEYSDPFVESKKHKLKVGMETRDLVFHVCIFSRLPMLRLF